MRFALAVIIFVVTASVTAGDVLIAGLSGAPICAGTGALEELARAIASGDNSWMNEAAAHGGCILLPTRTKVEVIGDSFHEIIQAQTLGRKIKYIGFTYARSYIRWNHEFPVNYE